MESGGQLVYALMGLALVAMSLSARRLPLGETVKMILAWIAIFAVLFVLFSFRAEFKQIWNRVTADFAGTANQSVRGTNVEITRGDDGHYSVIALINGNKVPFLIDSGATITSMSADSAADAGVVFDRDSFPVIVDTANGRASSWRADPQTLRVETVVMDDVTILVMDTLGDTNLLGMNFLDRLKSWRVEGDKMILEP